MALQFPFVPRSLDSSYSYVFPLALFLSLFLFILLAHHYTHEPF